jgi:hypothetical protein
MKIYVVYWADICLKKSMLRIIGAFTEKEDAEKLRDKYHHIGYTDYYFTKIKELELDKIPEDTHEELKFMGRDYEMIEKEYKIIKEEKQEESEEEIDEEEYEEESDEDDSYEEETEESEEEKKEEITDYKNIPEEDVLNYCVCFICKKIVRFKDIPYHHNHISIDGDSTLLQKCKECNDKECEEIHKKSIERRKRILKKYFEGQFEYEYSESEKRFVEKINS